MRKIIKQLHESGLTQLCNLLREFLVNYAEGQILDPEFKTKEAHRVMEGHKRLCKVVKGCRRSWKVLEGQSNSIKFMCNVIEVEGHEKSWKLTEGFILTLDVYLVESPPLSIV